MKILPKMLISFVSIVLIFGIAIIVTESLDSQRENENIKFLYEERALSIEKTIDAALDDDAQLEIEAQTLIDKMVASDLGLVELTIVGKAPEGKSESGYWTVASNDKSIIHGPPEAEDVEAIKTDKYNVISTIEDGKPIIDVNSPLHDSTGRAFASTCIKFDMSGIESHMVETNTLLIALVITLLAIIATFFVANSITKPIKELKDVADKVSMGDLQQNITVTGNDEIGELGQSFQRMINAFKISQAMNEEEAGGKV
jgi:methyl-accepting chemotaxis protein